MNQRSKNKIRLYTAQPLSENNIIELGIEDTHYLCDVMRQRVGDKLSCFNNTDGEFDCQLFEINKKNCRIKIFACQKSPQNVPDIWLMFTPLKKDNTDFVIQKATELGAKEIIPVITRNTITDKVKIERFCAQAKEAAEQCERTDVPIVQQAISLETLLNNWPQDRKLFFMDERLHGEESFTAFAKYKNCPAAILVGPEGGFTSEEKNKLDNLPFVCGVSLGPRILRAETAACAALSVWQSVAGDWKKGD